MKVLILAKEEYHAWLYSIIKDYFSDHDIHIWSDGIYPFDMLHSSYDVGISFMYTHKVPAKEVNSHSWFNFHPAPLPNYKGRNLCYHAIMNGETTFGATIHYMDENFDTGDIIQVYQFAIYPDDTAEDVSNKAIQCSKLLFEQMFPRILAGEEFERHPNVGGHYYKKEPIDDYIGLTDYQDRKLRAITYGDFRPKIDSGGVTYKIVRDE